ncbi:hypothetical protein [Streptomyces sp. IBSBF 2435]|uniref:hypothetical protein n=1 Tax=Streptomyces sp. IBSBF 2435 TaxID=2903531 RepID=UPI002FDC4C5F
MTETESEQLPAVGDRVHDAVEDRTATVSDVRGGTVYVLRVAGGLEWHVTDPDRLTIVTRRADRTDWPYPGFRRPAP